jgi:hypothetical protein
LGLSLPQACFKCAGCERTLNAGSYVDHELEPYCKSCYDKLFRPKVRRMAVNRVGRAAAPDPHQRLALR